MSSRKPIRGKTRRAGSRGFSLRAAAAVFWLLLLLGAIFVGAEFGESPPPTAAFLSVRLAERGAPPLPVVRAPRLDTETEHLSGLAAKIAIVIDDLGNDTSAARAAIALPKAISLSFLPYPDATPMLAREAARVGHAILAHVPMEPEGDEDAGPMALRVGLPDDEITRRLDWALARVPGYSGINNHMGSKFTADRDALAPVMRDIAARGVFFLDSRTTANTKVVDAAKAFGVAAASRDVFLDDGDTQASIEEALQLTEARARKKGVAIAIGHPRPATLEVLEAWARHISFRRVALISIGEAVALSNPHADLRAGNVQ